MAVVAKAQLFCDLADAQRCAGQKIAGFQDTLLLDILLGCLPVMFLKAFDEIGQAHAAQSGEKAVGDRFAQMSLDVAFCHFPGNRRAFSVFLLGILLQ